MSANSPENQHSVTWLQYTKGLIGHPIDISIEATRRALRDQVSREGIIQMLSSDPFKIQIARTRGADKSERYKDLVLKHACYLEKVARERQQQQLLKQLQSATQTRRQR